MSHQPSSPSEKPTLHVLHVSSGDLWAGAEVMLFTLAKALNNEPDTQVSVVIFNPGILEKKLRSLNIPVFIIDESKLNIIRITAELNRIIDELSPDVIHTHRMKENIVGSISAWQKGRIPSLQTLHGKYEHRAPLYQLHKHIKPFLDWFVGRFYQRYIVAVSPELAIELEKHFPRSKIITIENGVDIENILQRGHQQHPPPRDDTIHIAIAGRLMPIKRIDLFIETAIYLKEQRPDIEVHFHIYGDGPLLADLQAMVTARGAQAYIHFEGHCDTIPQQLASMDALMMTSDHEGLPMILLEAMCMKTPIIAHAVGGIPHLLAEGECGSLVQEHTRQGYARAISRMLDDPDHSKDKADLAYQRLIENYSSAQTAANYLGYYRQLKKA